MSSLLRDSCITREKKRAIQALRRCAWRLGRGPAAASYRDTAMLGVLPLLPLLLVALLLLAEKTAAAGVQPAGFRLTADLNTFTSLELGFAGKDWRLNGTWVLDINSGWNGTATRPSAQQWHQAIATIGSSVYSEQMYGPASRSAGECSAVRKLSGGILEAAFVYNESGSLPRTMLLWDQITNASITCGCGIIGHTRLYAGTWRAQVDRVVNHPNLSGVAIEIDVTRYSQGHPVFGQGGRFARSILAHGKQPFFLLPFKGDGLARTGVPAAQQMRAFLSNISAEGVDLTDPRINIVIARYGPSGNLLPVMGRGDDTVTAAVKAAQAWQQRPDRVLDPWLHHRASRLSSRRSSDYQVGTVDQRPLLIHNETLIATTWSRLRRGDSMLAAAVRAIEAHAIGHLSAGPFSVVQCPATPPSGDKHDYMSTAVYWWPCSAVKGEGPCNNVSACAHGPCNCTSMDICGKRSASCNATTGLPWHSCDGHENHKQINQGGLPQLSGMGAAVQALAAGFYWSRNETYAARATQLISTFFLDPRTKMNPNFKYGQSFPGVNDGCGSGLVEIDQYLIEVLEAINLISRPAPCGPNQLGNCVASPSWTPELDAAMVNWLTQWSAWMKSTPFSTWACNFYNNHNAACRSSWLAVAVWIGDHQLAHRLLVGAKERQWTNTSNSSMPYQLLGGAPNCAGCDAPCSGTCGVAPIGGQILKDGEMPRESERVNGIGYTCAELGNLLRLAQLSRHPIVADDLYAYVSRSGSSIRGALEYVVPFALDEKKWPHPSEAADWYIYAYLRQAAAVFGNSTFTEWAEQLEAIHGCSGGCAADASNLWWPSTSTSVYEKRADISHSADDDGRVPLKTDDHVLYLLSRAGGYELVEFEYDNGGEFPGGQGALACCPDTFDMLCVSHNLTSGGHYNGAKFSGSFLAALGQARPTAIVLDVAAPRGAWLSSTVIDATGQIFSAEIPTVNASADLTKLWRVWLPLDNTTFHKHYGGADDGVLHLPLLGFIVTSAGSHTTNTIDQFRFANLSLEFSSVADIPSAAALTLSASVIDEGIAQQAPGNLTLILGIRNRLQSTSVPFQTWASIQRQSTMFDYPSGMLSTLMPNETDSVAGWGCITRVVNVSTLTSGYFPLQLGLQPLGAAAFTLWHGIVIRPAVVQMAPPLPAPAGVFGLNNVNIGLADHSVAAAAAIGVRTIRGQVIWRYTVDESNPNNESFSWGAYDTCFAAASQHNMSVLLNIFPMPPSRFANSTRPRLPRSDALKWLTAFAEAAVRRYGQNRLLGVSVDNEPDATLWLMGGAGSYGEALPVTEAASIYAAWLGAVKEGVRRALGDAKCKEIPFGGLSVSGGEWSIKDLEFVRAVAAVAAKEMSLFTGHPYACNAKLGCSGDMFTKAKQWVFPSESDGDGTLTEKLQRAAAVLATAGANASKLCVWPSEFGWALESDAAPTSLLALGHAAAVSQGLVLMRALASSPQYGPFYLFAAAEDGLEGGPAFGGLSSFGLWRTCESISTASYSYGGGQRYPLPAAAAYATASALLELPTAPLEEILSPLSSQITWKAFQRPALSRGDNATGILAVWLRGAPAGATSLAAPGRWNTTCIAIRAGMVPMQIYSGLGQEMPSGFHSTTLQLSPLPIFVVFSSAMDGFVEALSGCAASPEACVCR